MAHVEKYIMEADKYIMKVISSYKGLADSKDAGSGIREIIGKFENEKNMDDCFKAIKSSTEIDSCFTTFDNEIHIFL